MAPTRALKTFGEGGVQLGALETPDWASPESGAPAVGAADRPGDGQLCRQELRPRHARRPGPSPPAPPGRLLRAGPSASTARPPPEGRDPASPRPSQQPPGARGAAAAAGGARAGVGRGGRGPLRGRRKRGSWSECREGSAGRGAGTAAAELLPDLSSFLLLTRLLGTPCGAKSLREPPAANGGWKRLLFWPLSPQLPTPYPFHTCRR